MNILGLSAFYHESACCLLQDGQPVAAASEERFSRVKHDPRLPVAAFGYCLREGRISLADLDCIAYYESPVTKLARQLWAGVPRGADPGLPWLDPRLPESLIRERLGYEGPILFLNHHLSHAASAFHFSGFEEAAILTADGVGEWATTTYCHGTDRGIRVLEEVEFPNSLGLFYSTITSFLGFEVNSGEFKVMGLAAYGEPRYRDHLGRLLSSRPGGQFELDQCYFDFVGGRRMFSPRLRELLGFPAREPESPIDGCHCDLASSLQAVLEDVLLGKIRYLAGRVDSANLCLAGGVALNSVANGRILREGPFERVFIQPAAGDAGGCLGAAALAHAHFTGLRPSRLRTVFLGPGWDGREIDDLFESAGVVTDDFGGRPSDLAEGVVDRLEAGKVVGWFQGRMEFGPRALGARSILADPRVEGLSEHLNSKIKKRESFRPFAPSVLENHAAAHFDLNASSPFMLLTCQVRSPLDLPAVTHRDGSARPQTVSRRDNPRFADLLERFGRRTGCPILLQTSLNTRGEPIACSPADALRSFVRCDLDSIAVGHRLLDRENVSRAWRQVVLQWPRPSSRRLDPTSSVPDDLYTFV